MKLADALTQLDDFDPDEAIFIHPQSRIEPDCEVLVTSYSDDGEPPATTVGMKYLLEVSLVRDALVRINALVAALKQHRRQARAVQASLVALRELQTVDA